MKTVDIANKILSEHEIIFYMCDFYVYEKGCYKILNENIIAKWVKEILSTKYTSHKVREVISCLKADCYKEAVDNNLYLNLRNGLLDVGSFTLFPHCAEVRSTVQLNVNYNPEAKCDKWLEVLKEIFDGDQAKVQIIQEFFGLSFTTVTKFEKVLFLIGEGANGKSVILFILEQILGPDNCSAIPLEKFNNSHYMAHLFGKLANISIETNAKAEVYDSTFKAVVSGDSITADPKFKHPFTFKPFSKLIFALNNMPRVDDKTSAFFRRLLIARFNRIFKEEDQNKNLKYELLKEIDGIFYWCLQGLKKLNERGQFDTTAEMRQEIDEYRKENNNVLIYVEEKCLLGPGNEVAKDELWDNYSAWCKSHGYMPLSLIKFGKELKKQFSDLTEERSAGIRSWRGIKFNKFE